MALLPLMAACSVSAVPVTYDYSDVAFGLANGVGAGVGSFAVDIPQSWPNPPHSQITLPASQFSGGPGASLGSWTQVVVDAQDTLEDLRIQDSSSFVIFPLNASDVGKTSWATPQEAWDDLVSALRENGVRVTPETGSIPVADSGNAAVMLAMGLGFLGVGLGWKTRQPQGKQR